MLQHRGRQSLILKLLDMKAPKFHFCLSAFIQILVNLLVPLSEHDKGYLLP